MVSDIMALDLLKFQLITGITNKITKIYVGTYVYTIFVYLMNLN